MFNDLFLLFLILNVFLNDRPVPEAAVETTPAEVTDNVKANQENNPPVTPQPPAEPELPPPSIPPDETPQRARRVMAEDEGGESDKEPGLKHLQRIEILQITEAPQLIEPSEVIVRSGAICETAEPVLTPVGKYLFKNIFYVVTR